MSIQWTVIAAFLYIEIAVVSILISPILSPRKWYRVFQSRFISIFREQTSVYFYGLLCILSLFLLDSIREMRKYSIPSDTGHNHLASEMKGNVKLFRAQRNFYITGFAIFLSFVIRRLVKMITTQYDLQLKAEEIIKKVVETVKLTQDSLLSESCEEIKNKLEETKNLLEEEKLKVQELKKEATKWRLKYEKKTEAQGDN